MQLSLTNYQSWSSAQLKVEGLTVVVGPSNLGKSALGRAFKGLVRNDILPDHIKLGTEGVVVSAIIAGQTVTAKRGAKAKDSTVYDVDGAEFAKLGGDIPQAVKDMAFGPVEVNGVTIDPVFAGQFDGQFLLGNSPAELNSVLNAFASTEKLDKGRRELAKRTTDTNATAKALLPQISALEEQSNSLETTLAAAEESHAQALAAAKEVTRLDKAVAAAGALLDALEKLRTLQHQIIGLSTLLAARDEAIKLYKGTARCITAFISQEAATTGKEQGKSITLALAYLPPATDIFHAAKALRNYLTAREVGVKATQQAVDITMALDNLPAATAAYLQAQGLHNYLGYRSAALQADLRVKALDDVDTQLKPCLVTYKALVRIKALREADPAKHRALAQQVQDLPLDEPKKFLQAGIILKKLVALVQTAEGTTDNLMTLGLDMASLDKEAAQITAQIETAREAGTIVTCPKCSHEFSPAHAH